MSDITSSSVISAGVGPPRLSSAVISAGIGQGGEGVTMGLGDMSTWGELGGFIRINQSSHSKDASPIGICRRRLTR